MKTIQLCADDFGQDPLINLAVLELFNQHRLSATSVLIDGPHNLSFISDLQNAYNQGLEVGLHFNLTLAFPNNQDGTSIKPLSHWIGLSQFGLIPTQRIHQTISKQLTKFEDTFGFAPDYIDGHQHVHQFPGIGSLVIEEVLKRYPMNKLPWIRNTLIPPKLKEIPERLKCTILKVLGGKSFFNDLIKAKIPTNSGFLGVYGFNAPDLVSYQKLMQAWLNNTCENTLMMCHPAINEVKNDAIGKQRPIEYAYLHSSEFTQDLKSYQVRIARKNRTL